MDNRFKSPALDYLFQAFLELDTVEECYDFFEDLCTVKEIQSMAQRMEVAKMLKEKKTYNDITDKTGASTVTISRVNRILNYGNGSLKKIIDQE